MFNLIIHFLPRAPARKVEIDSFSPSKTNTPGLPVYVRDIRYLGKMVYDRRRWLL